MENKPMFVKMYTYKIRSKDFEKWRIINDAANSIYREYGVKRLEQMMRRTENEIGIIDFGYYESQGAFEKIAALVDQDKRIIQLFSEFKKLVSGEFIQEEYETI
ncbi:MAG: hypothetical protein HYW78_04655 [Parcubacteria group bacterium]|nr:hypothetical protein [Parcubacteria group bacterium]